MGSDGVVTPGVEFSFDPSGRRDLIFDVYPGGHDLLNRPVDFGTTYTLYFIEILIWGKYYEKCTCSDAWRGPWGWRFHR